MLSWTAKAGGTSRSVRYYDQAEATIKIADSGTRRSLPDDARLVLAEIGNRRSALGGIREALTCDQRDLIDMIGNPLALDRLLPGQRLAAGDSWQHGPDVIEALIGLERTAVC